MQAYFQKRRIYRQLQKQIVTEHQDAQYIWTHERRFWYFPDGGLMPESCDPHEGAAAERWSEHGHRTRVGGPALEVHTARSHMERDGDVERADMDPEFNVDPYPINSRDTIGADVDIVITGVERARYVDHQEDGDPEEAGNGESSANADEDVDRMTAEEKQNTIIVVSYEDDTDPMDPHNWSFVRRFACTTLISLLGSLALWSSTIDPPALIETTKLFHTNFEIQSLPTGLGGMLTAPVSEVIGRNPVYIVCLILFILLETSAALSQNLAQRIVSRGLAGLFASGPLVCSAAALVDLWSLIERVYMFPYYAMILELGATVGPVPGSYIVMANTVSWRFVDWSTAILTGLLLALVILFLPETYSPVLLRWKAQQLRRLTGDDRYRAPLEFKKVSLRGRFRNAFSRPIIFFWTEPIIVVFSAYMAIVFIILYTFTAGFASIFEENYGLNQGETGLCFLAISTGIILASVLVPLSMRLIRRDIYHARRHDLARPEPECNLYMSMFGAPIIPLSLFWMGWTARPSISIWCPLPAALAFGFGVLGVVVSSYQYIAATFEYHTASALSTIQAVRVMAAGAMAVLAEIMYKDLGEAWTLTLLGGIAMLFLPVPFLLFKWGSRVRHWSKFAREHERTEMG
ncbi:uncharacterized protein N7496_009946 [Penicillium cataractarum]|uniref:Major facilitator superfamily (MFS) profile domain-containing protein n=1 Tax=Penicillium cataractarum TaxID=2100454 RepID=A0A9W9RPX5_9EURO|nr:uncharacterized protein N7496_009946 [Penicillium cataractarum]KAJ5364233.1 hypothetical protein N7496_009946 [Penicillium cataractarum]